MCACKEHLYGEQFTFSGDQYLNLSISSTMLKFLQQNRLRDHVPVLSHQKC